MYFENILQKSPTNYMTTIEVYVSLSYSYHVYYLLKSSKKCLILFVATEL